MKNVTSRIRQNSRAKSSAEQVQNSSDPVRTLPDKESEPILNLLIEARSILKNSSDQIRASAHAIYQANSHLETIASEVVALSEASDCVIHSWTKGFDFSDGPPDRFQTIMAGMSHLWDRISQDIDSQIEATRKRGIAQSELAEQIERAACGIFDSAPFSRAGQGEDRI